MILWHDERDAALKTASTIVVKVGSAVLSAGSNIVMPILENLVAQLSALQGSGSASPRRVVLVSSGAVAAGRAALASASITPAAGLAARQALASIGQGRLMHLYDQAFASC